jgi:aminodeoxychorismate synthase component I
MRSLPWQSPLTVARSITSSEMVLLYSSMQTPDSGRYSYLAADAEEVFEGPEFDIPSGRVFGWLGYGLRYALESLPADSPAPITLPDKWLIRPKNLCRFDHEKQELAATGTLPEIREQTTDSSSPTIVELSSNFTKAEYLRSVEHTLEQIGQGSFYQANITRKFYGRFDRAPDSFALFERLCAISPAPYSAFIRRGNTSILSSSPERFLNITADGWVTAQPIKGSAPRGATPQEDEAIRNALYHSSKDRAENLMIVDLMRNDLSRACEPGTVSVASLYDIKTYATIHQMVSTISGWRHGKCSSADVVKACFPPGSMTGAPKIRAMQWCAEQERIARGVYSGAIGWFDEDGSCDLSVVIRTLIIQGNCFEFQVGGGIVADSEPEKEWEETLIKARAIAELLGIEMQRLQHL